jgi:hypothetical protein
MDLGSKKSLHVGSLMSQASERMLSQLFVIDGRVRDRHFGGRVEARDRVSVHPDCRTAAPSVFPGVDPGSMASSCGRLKEDFTNSVGSSDQNNLPRRLPCHLFFSFV